MKKIIMKIHNSLEFIKYRMMLLLPPMIISVILIVYQLLLILFGIQPPYSLIVVYLTSSAWFLICAGVIFISDSKRDYDKYRQLD